MINYGVLLNNLRSDFARQAVMNGNFDIWQRGTSLVIGATDTGFLADRWRVFQYADGGTLPTITHSRQILTSGDIPNAFYHYRINCNGAGTSLGVNSYGQVTNYIENGTRYLCGLGKKVTVSFWARSSIANKKLGVYLIQNYGTGGSPTSSEIINGYNLTLTSTWTKYSYTFTTNTLVGKTFGTTNDDYLRVAFMYQWGSSLGVRVGSTGAGETYVGSGSIDIAQVQLNAGSVALPFYPKTFDQEYDACQRYYQKSFNYATAPSNSAAYAGADAKVTDRTGSYQGITVTFPKKMRATPTTIQPYSLYIATANRIVDVNNSANAYACYVTGSDERGCIIESSSSIPSQMLIGVHWTADAEI